MQSALSDAELACISDDPQKLARALTGPGTASQEEQARLIGCLEDETLARLFLAGFVPGPEPLSEETSTCIRAVFEVIDPREVMTAGIDSDPGRAMTGSMTALSVTIACLNDGEWDAAASMMGMRPDEREGMRCLLDQLGGPGEMAEAMKAAGEGDFTDLAKAGADCGLDMGAAPGQASVTPPPTPTATVEAPTPVSTPTPVPTRAPPLSTTNLVITVAPIPAGIPEYDRDDWKHWQDYDKDCQDIRHEVLIAESLVEVTFKTDKGCQVATGRWYGVFDGHHLENAGQVDVDHMVPLKNAHNSGGWAWNPAAKENYANSLEEDDHLIAVASRANRSKGARGPEEWRPPDETYWCQYATDWTEIKERWDLTMTEPEAESVVEMLGTCETPVKVVTESGEEVPLPTPDQYQGPVYESCEEAESAGEERVLGGRGGGEGFPSNIVPSARDGDKDGVVCER